MAVKVKEIDVWPGGHNTKLEGVRVLQRATPSEDFRGSYAELYDSEKYAEIGISDVFVQEDISISNKRVLRGLHGDRVTTKLVTCLQGRFFFALVDARRESPTYGRIMYGTLSGTNGVQLYIPPGIGNSILCMEDNSIYHYKQTTHYVPGRQFTIAWDDGGLGIPWPGSYPILSERDTEEAVCLAQLQ